MQSHGPTGLLHRPQDTSLPLASNVHQIDGLQLLRAVAVILVLWCHAGQILIDHGSYALPSFGVFGIDIFFVISGFILSLTILRERSQPGLRPMWEFTKRRLIRIFPMYWFFASLALIRAALSHQLPQHNYLYALFLLPLPRYPHDWLIFGLTWTLIFEIFFYYTLAIILLKTIKWAVPALIVLLVASICIGGFVDIRRPFWIIACNPILLEFVFGSALALLYTRFGRRRALGIVLTIAGVAAAFCVQSLYLPNTANGLQMILTDTGVFARVFTWGICAALIVGGVIFWSPSIKGALGKWWVSMGNASYSTYVASSLVIEYGSRLFLKFGTFGHSFWNRLFYELYITIAMLLAGLVCYVAIEKPLLRKLQSKLLRKKPTTQTAQFKTAET
jgi:exopolysaccharide production protein ExoZ